MFRQWVRNLRWRNLDSVSPRREWYPDAAARFEPAVITRKLRAWRHSSMNMKQ